MSRIAPWQRAASADVSWHQDQALNATLYILRELGPTSFLLKEDDLAKKFKVCLGDPHSCTCTDFKKEMKPCKHICWILLKKFKLDRQDELSYQFGLVEREINEVLRNPAKMRVAAPQHHHVGNGVAFSSEQKEEKKEMEQRKVTRDDVCPICQDELLAKHQPVTYCRYGCGNSVHIKCMKVWVEHQRQCAGSSLVLCPFCREEFGSHRLLAEEFRNSLQEAKNKTSVGERLDHHIGTTCQVCKMSPIKGKCYQCSSCNEYHLCNTCFHSKQHIQHSFVFRLKTSQRWRIAPAREINSENERATLLAPIMNELQSRELTENDYEILLQLDGPVRPDIPVDLAGLPEHVINQLPMLKVKQRSRLLAPGRQCRLCLLGYTVGQFVRRLPECGHTFHRQCIDEWLRDDHRRCPVDRQLVINPESNKRRRDQENDTKLNENEDENTSDLVIPGIGLVHLSASKITQNKNKEKQRNTTKEKPRPVRVPRLASSQPVTSYASGITLNDLLVQADAISLQKPRDQRLVQDEQHVCSGEEEKHDDCLLSNLNFSAPAASENAAHFVNDKALENRNATRKIKFLCKSNKTDTAKKADVKGRENNFQLSVNGSQFSRSIFSEDSCRGKFDKHRSMMNVRSATRMFMESKGPYELLVPMCTPSNSIHSNILQTRQKLTASDVHTRTRQLEKDFVMNAGDSPVIAKTILQDLSGGSGGMLLDGSSHEATLRDASHESSVLDPKFIFSTESDLPVKAGRVTSSDESRSNVNIRRRGTSRSAPTIVRTKHQMSDTAT